MIVDTTGAFWFDPDSCSYTLNKTSDGTINTEVYVDSLAGKTYTKTYNNQYANHSNRMGSIMSLGELLVKTKHSVFLIDPLATI